MKRLENGGDIPKYVLLKEELLGLIKKKQLKPHDRLPSRNELVRDYGVSEITIRKSIDELTNEGYIYRLHGKGTFVAETEEKNLTIALMMIDLHGKGNQSYLYDAGFVAPVVQAVQSEAYRYGATTLLYLSHSNPEITERNFFDLMRRQVDGLIFLPNSEQKSVEWLTRLVDGGTPVVAIDRMAEGIDVDSVVSDNESGSYNATLSLIDAGIEEVHFFATGVAATSVRDRIAGYQRAMAERGLSREDYLHIWTQSKRDQTYEVALAVLKESGPNIGLFAVNPPLFVGVLKAVNDLELDVRNIGLACFDEAPVYVPDNIIYIKVLQRLDDMGIMSVRMTLGRDPGDKAGTQHVMIPTRLWIKRYGVIEEIELTESVAAKCLEVTGR